MIFDRDKTQPRDVVALVDDATTLQPILSLSHTLAQNRGEQVHALVMGESEGLPDWFVLPPGCDPEQIVVHHISHDVREILRLVNQRKPVALVIGVTEWSSGSRFLVNELIDSVIHDARCTVCLLKAPPDWDYGQAGQSTFVPMWDDPSAAYALNTALAANPNADITVGIPASRLPSDPDTQDYQQRIHDLLHPWEKDPRVKVVVVEGDDEAAALAREAGRHDLSLLGATRGNVFLRAVFGDRPHKFAEMNPGVTAIIREYQGTFGSILYRVWSRWERLLPSLGAEDRADTYRQVRRAGRPTRDFFMMIGLSAGIASIGLVLNSPAVIIGAMLVAPLMSAIVGMGLAVVHGDLRFLLTCGRAALKGALVAIATGTVVGLLTPLNEAPAEILNRTEPSYLDLIVALISGVAAAYALSRKDVSSALPGVAIAVALVPPLATVGVTLAYGELAMAWGALLLFLANLSAITFASALVFAALGFRPSDTRISDRDRARTTERSVVAAAILVLLVGVLLVFETVEQVREERMQATVDRLIPDFLEDAHIQTRFWRWQLDEGENGASDTISIVLNASRTLTRTESARFQKALSEELGREVNLALSVLPTTVIPADP